MSDIQCSIQRPFVWIRSIRQCHRQVGCPGRAWNDAQGVRPDISYPDALYCIRTVVGHCDREVDIFVEIEVSFVDGLVYCEICRGYITDKIICIIDGWLDLDGLDERIVDGRVAETFTDQSAGDDQIAILARSQSKSVINDLHIRSEHAGSKSIRRRDAKYLAADITQ